MVSIYRNDKTSIPSVIILLSHLKEEMAVKRHRFCMLCVPFINLADGPERLIGRESCTASQMIPNVDRK